MAAEDSVTMTPTLQYERQTGYIVLTDGKTRQVVTRPEGWILHLYWKKGKIEVPISLDHLVALVVQAAE